MDQYISKPSIISHSPHSKKTGKVNEAKIVWTAQKGDRDAFNHLVMSYQAQIFNLAVRILRNEDAAEEITQDTFVHAFINLSSFRNGSFYGWLHRIATNACYDEFRRYKRHPLVSIENEFLPEEKLFSPDDNPLAQNQPEMVAERHELEMTIESALDQIGPDQRRMIELIDQQEFGYRQAAQMLHIPIGTVKSRLARARSRLQKILSSSNLNGEVGDC
jgi:RNA polymerase sigma-70 factor (ECF subfamily)